MSSGSDDDVGSGGAELDGGKYPVDNVVRSSRCYLAQLLQRFLGKPLDFYIEQLKWDEAKQSSDEKIQIIRSLHEALANDDPMRCRILKLIDLDGKHGDRRFQIDTYMFPVIEGEFDNRDRGDDEMLCPHCLLAGERVLCKDLRKHLWREKSLCRRLTNITGVFVHNKWENEVHPTQRITVVGKDLWTYEYALVAAKYFGSIEKARALEYDISDLFFGMGVRGKRV